MSDTPTSSLQYFVIIAGQKKKEKLMRLLSEHGAHEINVVYGHGSMSPSAIAAAFGFEAEQSRVLISCLIRYENAKKVMDILYRDFKFDQPNTGIAYGIRVEGLAF